MKDGEITRDDKVKETSSESLFLSALIVSFGFVWVLLKDMKGSLTDIIFYLGAYFVLGLLIVGLPYVVSAVFDNKSKKERRAILSGAWFLAVVVLYFWGS